MKQHDKVPIRFSSLTSWALRARPPILALAALILAPSAWAECQELTVPTFSVTSWDSYGFQNFVRIEESRYPDTLAGKGPYVDRYYPNTYYNSYPLMVSDNVLAFDIPQLIGTVVSAELLLRVRYMVSSRQSEEYVCRTVTNPRVKLQLRHTLGPRLYEDSRTNIVYGRTAVAVTESEAL